MMSGGNELMHYGVLGMKWGVRRYQNKDGTLTNAGKKRLKEAAENIDQRNITKEFINNYVDQTVSSMKLPKIDVYAKQYMRRQLTSIRLKQEIESKVDMDKVKKMGYELIDDEYTHGELVKRSKEGLTQKINLVEIKDGIYRIVDNPNDAIIKADKFMGDSKTINKLTKDVADEFYNDIKKYYDPTNDDGTVMTKEQHSSRMSPYLLRAHVADNTLEICLDDDYIHGGHSLDAEIDMNTRKIIGGVSMNG